MYILGAGMAGLLCGALNPGSVILERQNTIPHNHHALFRLRSAKIGEYLGIPMRKVTAHKGMWYNNRECTPTIALCSKYSYKVTGKHSMRSAFDLRPVDRWIPPRNFIEQLTEMCMVEFGHHIAGIDPGQMMTATGAPIPTEEPIVSTLPLPVNLKLTGSSSAWMQEEKATRPIVVTGAVIDNCDMFCTMYYPGTDTSVYRASITGSDLIVESFAKISQLEMDQIARSFGIGCAPSIRFVDQHMQPYGKIRSIDNSRRTDSILKLTTDYNVYSLGRFATWREKVMLDDVFDDIFHIKRLINHGNYAAKLYQQED